ISRELLLRTRITTSSSENTLYYNAAITQLPFHVHIAAIDNGLAFPFKHPDEWRSYPYGWLCLPSSLIDRPFSSAIRAHLLPVLCDPVWWTQTVEALRGVFSLDSDFNERMFSRQIGIIKAQALNIIRTLLSPGQGPMDLCRRPLLIIDEVSVKSDLADYYYSNTACWVTVQNNTPVGSAQRELFAASSGQESPSRRRGVPKSNRNNEISHSLSGSAPANFSVDDLHLHTTVNTPLHHAPRVETSLRRIHSIPNCKSPSSDSGGNLPHNGLRGSDGNGDGHPIEVPASPRT
ncbi:Phosphatidylinositol 4-kinase, partial [Spiromyces aspiralis]